MKRTYATLAFTNQSIDSGGTVDSEVIDTTRSNIVGIQYEMADASTGTWVAASALVLSNVNPTGTFLSAVDSSGTSTSTIFYVIDSNDKFGTTDFVTAPYTKLRLSSATNNTLNFSNVWAILEEDY